MYRRRWKWMSAGVGLLTVMVFTGCQTAGSRSLGLRQPDAVHATIEADSSEQPNQHLAAAMASTGGTSIEGMPRRGDRPPARRMFSRPASGGG